MKRVLAVISLIVSLIILVVPLLSVAHSNIRTTPRFTTISGVELPDTLLELTNTNRANTFPPATPNFIETLNNYLTPNLTAETDAQIAYRINRYRQSSIPAPHALTQNELISEIHFLFDLLRYGYAAYQYFGGDDIFIPLKEAMIAQLGLMNDPILAADYLHEILLPILRGVIQDNHFWVSGHSIGVRSQLFMNRDLIIRQIDSKYLVEIDGAIYEVLEIRNGAGELIDGMLPTLTADGEFALAFGYVYYGISPGTDVTPFEITVLLENAYGYRTLTGVLPPVSDSIVCYGNVYSINVHNGVAVLENRRLHHRARVGGIQFDPQLSRFPITGRMLRNEPVLILDLRGHAGGNDGYAYDWIRRYTGQRLNRGNYNLMFTHVRLNSATTNALQPWISSSSPPSWDIWESDIAPVLISNEHLLIVLTDNSIGSAGDVFVGLLRQLDNVLIVGTNTRGVLVTGNLGQAILPRSRIEINFGVSLNIRPDFSQFEGVGFMPDLWVPPDESLERVLRLIERYKFE